jgi:pimeloyl-ACP methyl ester carboxylesterase
LSGPCGPSEREVRVAGGACRVWEKGEGAPVAVLAGLGGFPRWTAFLEALSARRRVVVPSLPGFPGGSMGHKELDDIIDWVAMGLDLLDACGLEETDLVGLSLGGMVAAELAAVAPRQIRGLVLVAPFGIQDEAEPTLDPYGVKGSELPGLISRDRERYDDRFEIPEAEDPTDWFVSLSRAHEAAARLLWPTGDRGIAKRLHRIRNETLLVWGSDDQILPGSYAKRWADGIGTHAAVASVEGAGHLVDLDAPEALTQRIDAFLS